MAIIVVLFSLVLINNTFGKGGLSDRSPMLISLFSHILPLLSFYYEVFQTCGKVNVKTHVHHHLVSALCVSSASQSVHPAVLTRH